MTPLPGWLGEIAPVFGIVGWEIVGRAGKLPEYLPPPSAVGARVDVFFSSRRRHTRFDCDWSSDVCSSDLFTESVRSFHVPATPGTIAWPPSLPSVPTSRATRVTSEAKERS